MSDAGAGLDRARAARAPAQLGDAEVEHLDALVARDARVVGHEEEVVGLEVAVDDALGVRGAERRRRSARAMSTAARAGSRPTRREPRRQALALEQLHDDVGRRRRASVPKSKISTMFGWRIAFAARASLKKRRTSSLVAGELAGAAP